MNKLHPVLFSFVLLCFLGLSACGNGDQGNASSPAVSEQEAEPEEVVPVVEQLQITGSGVNVRSAADAGSKVLVQVGSGEKFDQLGISTFFETIGEKTDFWYEIDLGEGQSGWVFGAFTDRALSKNERTDRLVFEDIAFGDYYHLVFSWPEGDGHGWKCGQYYMQADGSCDFGYGGPHELSGYELDIVVEDGELSEIVANPEFQSRKFDVTWRVKLSDAYEGEGSMETIPMETPQILGLELVEE